MDVRKISGTLQNLGPALYKHIESDPVSSGSAHYAYMRVSSQNGESIVVDHVAVAGHVAAFMRLGDAGTFYFAPMQIGRIERNVLFAIAMGPQKASQVGYVAHAVSATKWEIRKALFFATCLLLGGLVTIVILVGIPITLFALYHLVKTVRATIPARYPSIENCTRALKEAGFQT